MTIQATPSEISYAADGVTVIFPIPFPFDTSADLKLTSTDAGGNILTLSTGFTVSGGGGSTGNATFAVAPVVGLTITIYDNPALTQPTNYVSLDAFPAESHERALDRVTRIAKRLYQLVQRSVRFPDGDVSTDGVLGSVANRKGKYLFFNAITGAIEYAANIVTTTLSQSIIGQLLNPQTSAEATAGVVPVNYFYPSPDIRRYGALIDGVTSDATAVTNAVKVAIAAKGPGYILHPGGNCVIASQILAGNNFSIRGFDRTACVFTYGGAGGNSAFRITNNGTASPAPNSSGYGRYSIEGVTITTAIGASTAGALEINAGGFAFYEISNARFTGTFKYGLILDGVEVSHAHHNIIDNSGPANSANIWIVNGADRTATQSQGFTNVITINDNQINGATIGIADDGGSNHNILHNNINGNSIPLRLAGMSTFKVEGNGLENAGVITGEANIDFLTTSLSSVSVGPCQGGTVTANVCAADMAGGGTTIKFGGSALFWHTGIVVEANRFRNNLGRVADIDVTRAAHCRCTKNYTEGSLSGSHYTGVHHDVNGNELEPPQPADQWRANTAYIVNNVVQNGSLFYVCTVGGTSAGAGGPTGTGAGIVDGTVTWNYTTSVVGILFSQAAHIFGDSRFPVQFYGGVDARTSSANSSANTGGLRLDGQKWQNFTLNIVNTAGTLQYQIWDSPLTVAACAYADKIINQGTVLTNLVLNLAVGTGFGSTACGLISGGTSQLVFNTAGQVAANSDVEARITHYDGNVTSCNVICGIVSRNINGVTISRVEVRLENAMTGAPVLFDTTLLPAGKTIQIQVKGFIL